MYTYWLLVIKLKYSEYSFSYIILQYVVYWDPGKGKVNAGCVTTTTSCLILNVLSIFVTNRKFLGKMYIDGTLSKSHNIALMSLTLVCAKDSQFNFQKSSGEYSSIFL